MWPPEGWSLNCTNAIIHVHLLTIIINLNTELWINILFEGRDKTGRLDHSTTTLN